jgi:hypothetical protein
MRMTDSKPTKATRMAEAVDRLPEAQRERLAQVATEISARHDAPRMMLSQSDDELNIRFDCENAEIAMLLQMADMGTTDKDFHLGLVGQIACLGSHARKVDSTNSNFVVSVVRSVQPRDELETMLATQMGAIHAATMMMARRFNHVENIRQQDAAERALNKLARTFAMQMDTLKRYRTGGQQRVTVEHVTVNSGGQAIVGAVTTGGGGQR